MGKSTELETKIGTSEDPGGTKILTAREKRSRMMDVRTKEHFEVVKKVVNEAIKMAIEHYSNKDTGELEAMQDEILDYALVDLIIPMRKKILENSQNLILRNADHYLVAAYKSGKPY